MTEEERLQKLQKARDGADSWLEWYRLTPLERMRESMKLWQFYLQAGGSLDPEPDSQSPFNDVMPRSTPPAYRRSGVRTITAPRSLAVTATSSSRLMKPISPDCRWH